ncbi:MAG: hypothetical protein ACRDJL_11590, partial [Actinomycetota bacterium]
VTGRGLRALMAPIVTRETRKSTVAALDELKARLGVLAQPIAGVATITLEEAQALMGAEQSFCAFR